MDKNRFLTPVQAKKIMDSEDVIILDVRTKEELKDGYIHSSILLPLHLVEEKIESYIQDKNKKVLIYCRSGKRSKEALKIMLNMGYPNVYEFGGIIDWPFEITF